MHHKTKTGLILLCLLISSSCASVPPSPAPVIIINTCDSPTPCQLSAQAPATNKDLDAMLESTEADWAECAAKVEAHIRCNEQAKHE